MKPEEWQQVKSLFEEARQMALAERDEFLRAQTRDDSVRTEVSSLLAAYEESPEFLEQPAPRPPSEAEAAPMTGRMLGPWRLTREIGHGGMGVVWEAERADGAYEQRVAVKLLRSGSATQAGIVRFREERRILAFLEHPSIARLLDGGTTEDGTPYLVMEYVQGEPIDEWCARSGALLKERLRLFLTVCDAVDYAHRRLVIHRDLKPANVLVTADGSVKLLDFGIAKLLEPGTGAETKEQTERILTPGFASPEQVKGKPAGTTSDVYSLGVLLYSLAAGRRPYASESGNPLEALRAVLEVDPPPPSAAAGEAGRALRGELDDIILLAMRKDPEERYGSVQAFSDDIRAWLEGREVKAHPEPLWRRSLKTARRHRAVSLATGLAVVSILAGSVVSIWQARTAQRERVRAENNFREVRQFSRAVLFELNDAIRNLPGSTPARLLLVERATEMLDNLSRTAAGDPALMMELAEGYRRVGQIQGSTFSDNVGQVDAAISSFRKAVRLAENAVAATVGSAEASILLEDTYEDLGDAVLPKDPGESDAIYAKHRVLVEQLDKVQRPESRTRLAVATGYSSLGFHQIQRNHFPEAKADFQRATERFEALAGKASELREWRVQYAFALKRLGAILIKEEALEPAEVSYRKALAIEDADVAANPKERRKIIDRTMTLSDLALIQRKRGNLDAAMRSYSEVVRIRTEALDADPKNLRLLRLTVGAELNLANVDGEAGRHEEALSLGRMALSRREEAQRAGLGQAEDLANAQVSVAILLASAAEHSRGPERGRLLAEGESLVRKAAPVLSTPQGERQTLAQQNSWEQLVEARVRLKKAAAAR